MWVIRLGQAAGLMVDWGAVILGTDWPQLLIGGGLFWLPGLAWAWALTRELGPALWLPISIVLAFTVQPFTMLLVNLLFGVPIQLGTTVTLSVALAMAGLAVGLRERVQTVLSS